MYSQYYELKVDALKLRMAGKTYGEIRRVLGEPIPKSTLSYWFRGINLNELQQKRIQKQVYANIQKAQLKAQAVNRTNRERYIETVRARVHYLAEEIHKKGSAKIELAMLYLGEGGKNSKDA